MANTPTPASVAARLTDEQIESIAESLEYDAENLYGDNTRPFMDDENNAAAVLRDYVRLRKLANAIKVKVEELEQGMTVAEDAYSLYEDIKRLLTEEKGEAE